MLRNGVPQGFIVGLLFLTDSLWFGYVINKYSVSYDFFADNCISPYGNNFYSELSNKLQENCWM